MRGILKRQHAQRNWWHVWYDGWCPNEEMTSFTKKVLTDSVLRHRAEIVGIKQTIKTKSYRRCECRETHTTRRAAGASWWHRNAHHCANSRTVRCPATYGIKQNIRKSPRRFTSPSNAGSGGYLDASQNQEFIYFFCHSLGAPGGSLHFSPRFTTEQVHQGILLHIPEHCLYWHREKNPRKPRFSECKCEKIRFGTKKTLRRGEGVERWGAFGLIDQKRSCLRPPSCTAALTPAWGSREPVEDPPLLSSLLFSLLSCSAHPESTLRAPRLPLTAN